MARGIPEALEPAVLEQAASGKTSRQVAAWLEAEHGIKTSHTTVVRLLQERRQERAEVTRQVVQERVAATVTVDLDLLERHGAELSELVGHYLERAKSTDGDARDCARVALQAVEGLRKLIETKLHFAGAGAGDEQRAEQQDAARRVNSRLARLAASRAAGDRAPGALPDRG